MILLNKSFVYSFIVLSLSYSLVGVVEADVVVSQKSIWILLVCTCTSKYPQLQHLYKILFQKINMNESEDLVDELERMARTLFQEKEKMNVCVKRLVEESDKRDDERKRILLKEMKLVLAKLKVVDENVVKEFKVDAYDKSQEAALLFEEINALQCAIKNQPCNKEKFREDLETLKIKAENLDLGFLATSAQLRTNTTLKEGIEDTKIRDSYKDVIFPSSVTLNPKQFVVHFPKYNDDASKKDFKIMILHPDNAVLSRSLTLQKLKIVVTDLGRKMPIEQSSVYEKLLQNQAKVESNGPVCQVTFTVPRMKNKTEVSVSMFGTNITYSPIVVDSYQAISEQGNVSVGNTSIAIFDKTAEAPAHEGLDSSDLNSLDLTARRMFQERSLSTSMKKASRGPSMSTVVEESISNNIDLTRPKLQTQPSIRPILKPSLLVQDPPGSASNSPFAPKTGLASTMKGDLWGPNIPNNFDDTTASRRLVIDESAQDPPDAHSVTACIPDKVEEDSLEDPHLMLNASKAPSPTSANRSIRPDPCWDENYEPAVKKGHSFDPNTSLLPDYTAMADVTLWEEEIKTQTSRFNLARGDLVAEAVLKNRSAAPSYSQKSLREKKYLREPRSVAVVPQLGILLVTETAFNRIGIFTESDLQFYDWFKYSDEPWRSPTNILCSGDTLAIVETGQIVLFSLEDRLCHFKALIPGIFHGLTSGPLGEIISILETKGEDSKQSHWLASIRPGSRKITSELKVPLDLQLSSASPATMLFLSSSNSATLLASHHKIAVTDAVHHRLVEVDLETMDTRTTGFLGSQFGHFNTPAGVAWDDEGNILVADSKNNRLVLFNRDLKMVKVRNVQ